VCFWWHTTKPMGLLQAWACQV